MKKYPISKYNDNMSFTRFKRNGVAKWVQCVTYIMEHGPSSKQELLDNIWPERNGVIDRGYMSKLFANMNYHDILNYDYKSRKWELGNHNNVKMLKILSNYV